MTECDSWEFAEREPGDMKKGTSFMEILAVILILAVMLSFGMPSASQFFSTQKVSAQAALLSGDIRVARYWAMKNQTYTRLVFSTTSHSWVVQELTDSGGDPIVGEPIAISMTAPEKEDYDENPTYWRSIIEGSAREIFPQVKETLTPATPKCFFFRPDGMVVTAPDVSAQPIVQLKVKFEIENAETAIEVLITPAGVIESVEWYDENYEV